MATSLRNSSPLTFTARTLSDATDATNVSRGAMQALANLIPSQKTRGHFVCRPGAVDTVDFVGTFANPGFVSAELPIGNIVYGMVASDEAPGRDHPFAYDLIAEAFLPVAGVTAAAIPVSPPSTGDWTPPIVAQVGSRILVTHPGFAGDGGIDDTARTYIKFGWFDISGFQQTLEVDLVSGTPFLYGGFSTLGIQPGMAVTGSALIPAGATVVRVFPNSASANYFTADSHGTNVIDGINPADVPEMYIGKTILGPGVLPGTTIIEHLPLATQITLSQPTTSSVTAGSFLVYGNVSSLPQWQSKGDFTSGSAQVLNAIVTDVHTGQLIVSPGFLADQTYVTGVTGTTIFLNQDAIATGTAKYFSVVGSVIEMSLDATGSAQGPILISGGTREVPLWGSGDTAINPLPSTPLGVAQFNGRAYFACGEDGVPFSDALLPCVRTNATQALAANNAQPVTAIGPLMLQNAVLGGIVQSIMAFQGVGSIQQITGDSATANLQMNALPVPTGTLAPLTLVPTHLGLFFVAPDGLRLIDLQARVSDPIGQDGDGVTAPFLAVTAPPFESDAPASRMTASANGRTLRIDVPDSFGSMVSYWFDLTRKIWTGPHTEGASLVSRWNDTFLVSATDRSVLRRADDVQKPYSVYTDAASRQPLEWEWETCLLPDSGQMAVNTIIESTIMIALQPEEQCQINFLNETRNALSGYTMTGLVIPPFSLGTTQLGPPAWVGPDSGVIRQKLVWWDKPLIFKQGSINIRGLSSGTVVIGNFYARYQIGGYLIEVPQILAAG